MKSSTLAALTASALALPGLQALADSPPPETTLSYRVSRYQEDDLDRAKLLAGSEQRYGIDIHQLQLIKPLAGEYALTLTGSHESMSGASPWYAVRRGDSAAIVMSGATIEEARTDVSANARRYLDNGTLGVSLGYSSENDYRALSGGVDGQRHFNDRLTTVAAGLSFSADDLSPTDAAAFNRIRSASRQSRSLFLAVTQIINQNSLVQTGLSLSHVAGFLSDPYKLFDRRPASRTQLAWTTAYRRFIPAANAALHADYRYYRDNFGVDSHTLDLNWHQDLGRDWQVVPGLRYYSQGAADFFTPASDFAATSSNSADFRLSAYGALSGNLKLQVRIDAFTLSLSGERYRASAALGLGAEATSPALVSFTRWSFGVDYRY